MVWSVIFLVAAAVQMYGVFCLAAKKKSRENTGEALFLAITASVIFIVLAATVFAVTGIYSLMNLGLFVAASDIVFYFLLVRNHLLLTGKDVWKLLTSHRYSKILTFVLLSASVLYFAFPTAYLLGSRDPGLYLVNAVHISDSGSAQYESDSYIDENYDAISGIINLEYPGIYSAYKEGLSDQPGKLIAQFLPMFPATLAIGYDLGGLDGLIRTNAFLSVLAILALYYFVKRNFGQNPALIAAILTVVNPAQLWCARITQSEILAQLLFIFAVYLFAYAWNKDNRKVAAVSGFLLGIGVLNRVDILIMGLGIYAIVCYSALFQTQKLAVSVVGAASYSIAAIASLAYGYAYSQPYFKMLVKTGTLTGIIKLNVIFGGVVLLLLLVRLLVLKKLEIKNWVMSAVGSRRFMWVLCISFLALFLFAYFVRPQISSLVPGDGGYFRVNAMKEFCFYTSFFALPLSIPGLYSWLKNKKTNPEATFLFLLISLASLFGYIYSPSVTADHIWASRRWVTVCFPFISILCGAGIWRLRDLFDIVHIKFIVRHSSWFKNAAVILCVGYLVVFGAYQSRPFLFTSMFGGMNEKYLALTDTLDDEQIYFTDNYQIASVLHFVYHENVYPCQNVGSDAFRAYVSANKSVNYIGQDFTSFDFALDAQLIKAHTIDGQYLLETKSVFPAGLYTRQNIANVYTITLHEGNSESSRQIDLKTLTLRSGVMTGDEIYSTGTAGYVFFGPYASLAKGQYEISVDIEILEAPSDQIGTLDIVCEKGEKMLAAVDLAKEDAGEDNLLHITMTASLEEPVDNVEIRCSVNEGVKIKIGAILITKMTE